MTPEEKVSEWDEHTDPIQKRTEEEDIPHDLIEEAIEWARSQ